MRVVENESLVVIGRCRGRARAREPTFWADTNAEATKLDEMIAQSYVASVSQRDVGNLVAKLTGRTVSRSTASRVPKGLKNTARH